MTCNSRAFLTTQFGGLAFWCMLGAPRLSLTRLSGHPADGLHVDTRSPEKLKEWSIFYLPYYIGCQLPRYCLCLTNIICCFGHIRSDQFMSLLFYCYTRACAEFQRIGIWLPFGFPAEWLQYQTSGCETETRWITQCSLVRLTLYL